MKKLNLVVSATNILLALTGLVYLLCLAAKAYPAVTPVAADICLGLFVVTGWMAIAIFQAAQKAFEPIVLAVPCPRCGGMQFDRSVCGDCVEAICWEHVSRAEAKGDEPDLSFEEWFAENEDELMAQASDEGLDGELDFDFESWAEAQFEKSKSVSSPDLSFEEWFEENEEILMEEVAENDLDREADFDFESWAEARFFESK